MTKSDILPRFTQDLVARRAIERITVRAIALYGANGVKLDRQSTEMDLSATHANGCPLDFDKLAGFDDFNLMHDITGIYKHLNRETGELENCFLPRCAASVAGRLVAASRSKRTEADVRGARKARAK